MFVQVMFELLQVLLLGVCVGLVYGWLKVSEKLVMMVVFKVGEIDLLVVIMVIEVGVDVFNVLLMIIENVEWFGLVQLYQLCGWVGCGLVVLCCVLLYQVLLLNMVCVWLEIMCQINDGFLIVEKDLELCGFGELFGIWQIGLVVFCMVDLV